MTTPVIGRPASPWARLVRTRAVRTALAVQRRFSAGAGGERAAAIAYQGFLSLFPLLLLAGSAIGFALAWSPSWRADVTRTIAASMPGIGALVAENLDALESRRALAGLAGLVGLLWTGAAASETASNAMRAMFDRTTRSNLLQSKGRAVAATLALGTLGLAGVAAATAAATVDAAGVTGAALRAAGVVVALALDLALFAAAYRLLTPGAGPSFRTLLPGAGAAAFAWTVLKVTGGWYVARTVAGSSAVYGTFASAVGVLVFLGLAARLFVYGAALSATLEEKRR